MERKPKNTAERASIFLRNLNFIGAVALGGTGIVLESRVLMAWGAVNAAQAGFFELTRRWIANNSTSPQQRLSST